MVTKTNLTIILNGKRVNVYTNDEIKKQGFKTRLNNIKNKYFNL